MDKIFYIKFIVHPTTKNPDRYRLMGALAHIWVKENTAENASTKAIDYVRSQHWEFQSWETEAIETTYEQFQGKELAQERFRVAQTFGISVFYVGYESADKIDFSIN